MNPTAVLPASPEVREETSAPSRELTTYYDRPLLKQPTWIWTVPAYFFVGGIAGSAMTLGMAADLLAGRRLRAFLRTCRWTGAIGGALGSALLIADLGRKGRFILMLRVFRPTSPMSVGSWVLATATPLAGTAAVLGSRRGLLGSLGRIAGTAAGILGMPLATYTAVLLANSAVPVWLETRKSLPLLFGASSASALASFFELLPMRRREREIVRRFGLMGRAGDLAAGYAVERAASANPTVGAPFRQGLPGALWKAAKYLTAASLALTLVPGRGDTKRRLAGALGIAGGFALRYAVFHAGKVSAADPRAALSR